MTDETTPAAPTDAAVDAPALLPPQRRWHVFVLVVLTCGMYLCVWFYRHARNLARLGDERTRPWLWFLVPLVGIVVPFALRRLFERYAPVAEHHGVELPRHERAIGVLAFLTLVGVQAINRLDGPITVLVVLVVMLGLEFAALSGHLDTLLDRLPAQAFRSRRYAYTWPSWVISLTIGPLMLLGYATGIAADWNRYLRPRLAIGKQYAIADLPAYLVPADAWSVVDVGTNSDGSADAEFVGAVGTSYGLVFHHGPGTAFNNHVESRRVQINEEHDGHDCRERRSLDGRTLYRRVVVTCQGRSMGDPVTWMVTTIEDEHDFYELFSEAEAPRRAAERAAAALERLSQGFHVDRRGAR